MKNSQVAVLCAVILAAALIVAGSNLLLVRRLQQSGPAARHLGPRPPRPRHRPGRRSSRSR